MSALHRTRLELGVAGSLAALLAAGLLVVFGGAGRAARNLSLGKVSLAASYDRNGDPVLTGGANDESNVNPVWHKCTGPSASNCAQVPGSQGGGVLDAGPTAAGTVFELSGSYRGTPFELRSSVWAGTARAVRPPAVAGRMVVGGFARPLAARWVGGWTPDRKFNARAYGGWSGGHGPDTYFLNLEACPTRSATGCSDLSPETESNFIDGSVRLAGWYSGWYVFAVSQRLFHDSISYLVGPIEAPPVQLGALLVRSAPYGPISGPPAPTAKFLNRVIIRDGTAFVARVHCVVACPVTVEAHCYAYVCGQISGPVAHQTLAGSELVGVRYASLGCAEVRCSGRLYSTIEVAGGPTLVDRLPIHWTRRRIRAPP